MKLRVKYYKDMGCWIGEVQDEGKATGTTLWLKKTPWCFTKYGAKRKIRK